MDKQIGTAAGIVWNYLNENGEKKLTQLKKEVDLSSDLLNQSVGWLAREGKINIIQSGKSRSISLK